MSVKPSTEQLAKFGPREENQAKSHVHHGAGLTEIEVIRYSLAGWVGVVGGRGGRVQL